MKLILDDGTAIIVDESATIVGVNVGTGWYATHEGVAELIGDLPLGLRGIVTVTELFRALGLLPEFA